MFLSCGTIPFHPLSQVHISPASLDLMGSLFGSSGSSALNAELGTQQALKYLMK